MRPLELTLEGFKSYRKAQTFNFESRSLFGIVGPTGSGKSSILEGLVFALYGKTPTVESGTKKLINSQEEQARVQLAFQVDDVAWEVIRLIRQRGTSQTVLRRLDGVGDPVTGDRNVTERVEEEIGLDFESFRSSVVLPQGEFDRFLKATPTERSKILKRIFRLDRVDVLREAARARWQGVEGQITVHQAALDSLPPNPEVLLAEAAGQATEARHRLQLVSDALPGVLDAEQELKRSGQERARLETERAEVEAALSRLPTDESLRDLVDRHERAERRLSSAERDLEQACRFLESVEADELAVTARLGGDGWLAAVEAQLALRERALDALATAQTERVDLETVFQMGARDLPRRQEECRAAEALLHRARWGLRDVQQRHAAHVLRADLVEGQPCPVCDQRVSAVPESARLPGLQAAEDALDAAERNLAAARSRLEEAATRQAVAEERLRIAVERCESHRAELHAVEGRLSGLAPGVPDVAEELHRRRRALKTAGQAVAEARRQRGVLEAEERRARRELAELDARWREVANLLSHTSGILGTPSFSSDSGGLWEAAKRVAEAGLERLRHLESRAAALRLAAEAANEAVAGFRRRFGAGPQDQASDVLARARSEVTRLEVRVEELAGAMEKRDRIEGELAGLRDRRRRLERLIADFADSKFTAFLLDEQRRLLSRIGSEKFLELTGYYRFDEAGQFQVVDQRTGLTRTADTLSGGETFLASLSLALALSEAVALEGGRLGCFFLDEGFGSLDQESLDLALDGIENLAEPGRLIGLISHVPGVQARLDDLIVLERLGDGSTDVAQHEGPLGYASMLV